MKNKPKKKERVFRHLTIEIDLERSVTKKGGSTEYKDIFWLIHIWDGKPKNSSCLGFGIPASGNWSKDLPKVFKEINKHL